ncbi:KamA family radical SAM protein, partial [bacterium]|nr:KamA family radical SAM protein [bacterium]
FFENIEQMIINFVLDFFDQTALKNIMNQINHKDQSITSTPDSHTISDPIQTFRQTFYPETDLTDWNSWKWQLQNRIKDPHQLEKMFRLTPSERSAIPGHSKKLPVAITPYYAAVVTQSSEHVLRRTVIPTEEEFIIGPEETNDPLIEEQYSPLPNIVHRYPNRVLFLATLNCAVYCRYCTRARLVGESDAAILTKQWKMAFEYIQSHTEIREVIISGGDPLFLDTSRLEELVREIRKISHVDIVRIGTKIPITLPQRITDELIEALKQYHPIIISLHAIHPDELTTEAKHAIDRFVDNGFIVGSQTVLLKGINDSLDIMKLLMEKLLSFRVRPYTLYHCDMIQGSGHFRTHLRKGIDLIEGLRELSSGYAIPHYIVDPPGGKVTLAPETIMSKDENGYVLKNWQRKKVLYPGS